MNVLCGVSATHPEVKDKGRWGNLPLLYSYNDYNANTYTIFNQPAIVPYSKLIVRAFYLHLISSGSYCKYLLLLSSINRHLSSHTYHSINSHAL